MASVELRWRSYAYSGSSLNTREDVRTAAGIGRQLRNTAASSALGALQSGGVHSASGTGRQRGGGRGAVRPGSESAKQREHEFTTADRISSRRAFDASWETDLFGGIRREDGSRRGGHSGGTGSPFADVLVTLNSEVARNYVDARVYQRRLAIARENIETQKESLDLTKARFDAGLTSEVDVAQAAAALATTQSQIPLLDTLWQQSIHRLGVLLGQEPGALFSELTKEAPIPAVPPAIPVGLPSELLLRRPDIRQTERQLAAATALIGAATANLYPSFSLTGSLGSQTHDAALTFDRNSFLWSVGPAVRWPVFDGWRIRSNIEVQNALHGSSSDHLPAVDSGRSGRGRERHGRLPAGAGPPRFAQRSGRGQPSGSELGQRSLRKGNRRFHRPFWIRSERCTLTEDER